MPRFLHEAKAGCAHRPIQQSFSWAPGRLLTTSVRSQPQRLDLCLFFAAETPIEEFTPTPAFPALQYLESVDVEGVAWRAGLRTGDFLIEVSVGGWS